MIVKVNARSTVRIIGFYNYICEQGYPENAARFVDRLYSFIGSLKTFPEKYPLCRNRIWSKRKFRCAVFEKNYVLAYSVRKTRVLVTDIRHAAMLA